MQSLVTALLALTLAAPPGGTGDVVGTVRLHGPPPTADVVVPTTDHAVCGPHARPAVPLVLTEDNEIAGAVVWIAHERLPGWRTPAMTFVMDQRRCEFVPQLLVVPPGATIEVRNSDGILHNFHTRAQRNPRVNLGQPARARALRVRFEHPEIVEVYCDVHGSGFMRAWIVVAEHPYYAVTDARGRFRLPGAPEGPHTLAAWHPGLGQATVPITVPPAGEARADIALPTTADPGAPRRR